MPIQRHFRFWNRNSSLNRQGFCFSLIGHRGRPPALSVRSAPVFVAGFGAGEKTTLTSTSGIFLQAVVTLLIPALLVTPDDSRGPQPDTRPTRTDATSAASASFLYCIYAPQFLFAVMCIDERYLAKFLSRVIAFGQFPRYLIAMACKRLQALVPASQSVINQVDWPAVSFLSMTRI